jgi:hypothetical protein
MKELCVVGYNYGNKYAWYIPIFVYSVLTSYPEYDVIVFTDGELDVTVKENIELLRGLGNFEIVEKYSFGIEKIHLPNYPGIMKSLRFLFYDNRFKKYKSIYIGDIDMFICKEEPGIYQQHLKHCDILNLPYSNYIRNTAKIEKPNIKSFVRNLLAREFSVAIKTLKKKSIYIKRLSGLHFVITEPYYNAVKQYFNEVFDYIINEAHSKDSDLFYRSEFDEMLLYMLIEKANIGLPPLSPDSPGLDYNNSSNINFRPHHGLHMGIFRSESNIIQQKQVLDSYIYREYINQYEYRIKNDKILVEILSRSPDYITRQFKKMHEYYNIEH